MTDIKEAGIRSIVAGMMERQAESAKAAPTGIVGGLWEKATGEIARYNDAVKQQIDLKSKQRRTIHEIEKAQQQLDQVNREVAEGLHTEAKAAEEAAKSIKKLSQRIEKLHGDNEELAESVNNSTTRLEQMNKGGGILRNGMTVLAAKAAGAAAAFFGFREAISGIDDRLRLASRTVADYGVAGAASSDRLESFGDVLYRITSTADDWNDAVSESTFRMMKYGIGADETRKMIDSYAEGLRLTTQDQGTLIQRTKQMTEETGGLAQLLRVNTDELASATVDASKRFGKATGSMSDDLANMYYSFQTIKESSRGTVINFGDLTRATLEAQSSFQGYNFNLKSTANLLGNVVAKAQEQGATYEMSMKAAQGLVSVLTGAKVPEWAQVEAGDKMLRTMRRVVAVAKDQGKDVQRALAEAFSIDDTTEAGQKQIASMKNLTENFRKYGGLDSAKMAEELGRGTDEGMKVMFKMMKKHADKPGGREMLMRVWNIDEAAATAAMLTLRATKDSKEFSEIIKKAQGATKLRKPASAADLLDQTEAFRKAVGAAEAGIVGSLQNILGALKQNPLIGASVGAAGTVGTMGLGALQTGAGVVAAEAAVSGLKSVASTAAATGSKFGKLLPMLGKGAGAVGFAGAVGYAIGSLLRLIPGFDGFIEKVIEGTAGLMGFKTSLNEAQTSQEALNNKSSGINKAIRQMTEAVTTDFNKDSLKRMIGVRQLQNASGADLQAYADKISENSNLTAPQVMERLRKLRSEKVSHSEFMQRRQAEMGLPPLRSIPGGAAVASTPTLGQPTAPRVRGGRGGTAAGRGVQIGPDGSIAMTVTIPTDALARSNAIATGMSE